MASLKCVELMQFEDTVLTYSSFGTKHQSKTMLPFCRVKSWLGTKFRRLVLGPTLVTDNSLGTWKRR